MHTEPQPSPVPPRPAPPPPLDEPSLPGLPLPGMAHPPSPEPTPPAAWTTDPFPGPGPVLRAGAGFLLLGLAGAVGRSSAHAAGVLPLMILGLAVLPGLIASPALLVLHQVGGRAASPRQLLHALTEAWMEAGRLAGGFAAVVLFFALTSLLGTELLFWALGLAGWLGLGAARRRLRQMEHAAGGQPQRLGGLLWAWTLLTTLIGARLAWMAVTWLQQAA